MKSMRWEKGEMVKNSVIVVLCLYFQFLSGGQKCNNTEFSMIEKKIEENPANLFALIIDAATKTYIANPYLGNQLIEFEKSTNLKGKDENFVSDFKKEFQDLQSKYDSLISCAHNNIREQVARKKISKDYLDYIALNESIFNYFKLNLVLFRAEYAKNSKIAKKQGILSQLTAYKTKIYDHIRFFLDPLSIPKEWPNNEQKAENKKLSNNLVKFFEVYNEAKTTIFTKPIPQDIEIVNFLKLLEMIPSEENEFDIERRAATKFVNRLQIFNAVMNKQWYNEPQKLDTIKLKMC